VWTTLITNTKYLSGLLTLEYSLREVGSKYPLVALYTDSFPEDGHKALDARGIAKKHIPYLLPATHKDFTNDPRFYDCWSKLTPFSLVEYDRVVQLDSDMMVRKNMDELMEIALDASDVDPHTGKKIFAASHACVCNPMNKPHYPKDWIPANCAFTSQHDTPDKAQVEGAPPTAGLAMPNGGLQVVVPSARVYSMILEKLQSDTAMDYDFADQSLLSDLFPGRWVALPYKYNALKTLRWKGVHDKIWRDEEISNIHYLLNPKPWDEFDDSQEDRAKRAEERKRLGREEVFEWWWDMTKRRHEEEKAKGIDDGF